MLNSGAIKYILVLLMVSVCTNVFPSDYNCSDQEYDGNNIVRLTFDGSDGEIYVKIMINPVFQGEQFTGLFLSQSEGRGLFVPIKTDATGERIGSWIIGDELDLGRSSLVAHFGSPCPLKVVKSLARNLKEGKK